MLKEGLLKRIGIGIFSAVAGAVIGAIISIFYGLNFWLPSQIEKLSSSGIGAFFGAIALIPITVLAFSILGVIVGAISGLLILLIIKKIKERKKKTKKVNKK